MTNKPDILDGVTVTTTVESFIANGSDGATVVVRTDHDLDIKFKRGEVAPNHEGRLSVAMILGIDDEPTDLILVHGEDAREALLEVREVVELALTGLKQGVEWRRQVR